MTLGKDETADPAEVDKAFELRFDKSRPDEEDCVKTRFEPRIFLRFAAAVLVLILPLSLSAEDPKILQEMTWTDVAEYLETSDMVMIPIGSTEQHGPHLPLGTDYYEALGLAGRISARTGVLVAPVVMAGYSVYHSGFPGSLSLRPETLEQVLFESAEILIRYGFRRILFFNYHGGNALSQENVIHRINHSTEAVAVAIGSGSPLQQGGEEFALFDYHAGIGETSLMLFLKPELVRMERAEKPVMNLTSRMQRLFSLAADHPALMMVFNALLAVPEGTGKGGSSSELSSNGVWSMGDPAQATKEIGEREAERMVENAVRFIEAWQSIEPAQGPDKEKNY
jgi:creatinine amidohydrolase